MTTVVGVHGIGNYHHYADAGNSAESASAALSGEWAAALRRGLAARPVPAPAPRLRVAYYAHLLHRGTAQGPDDVRFLDDTEQDLLIALVDKHAPAAIAQGRRTLRARAAADWITRRLGDRALGLALTFVREANAYLHSDTRRQQARCAVAEAIARDRPRVVIAHSLGTVIAYETLWEHPELPVDLLLTLGSPLAMPGVIFELLHPAPVSGRGRRPPAVAAWANLADVGDIVAIPRTGLAPHFDGVTQDAPEIVIGERDFHSVSGYLAAAETAAALEPYLQRPGTTRPDS